MTTTITEMTEPIRALIILPLLYAMLTQLRTGPDPNAYTFLAALGDGIIIVMAFLVAWWLIRGYLPADSKEEEPIWG